MTKLSVKDWLAAELQKSEAVVVYINPDVKGLVAPASQTAKPSFTLIFSHNADRPLIFRENDLKSDFLFDNGFQLCIIPWNSIWAAHPEGDSTAIVFWNDNSPGADWDKALLEFLKVNVADSKPEREVKPVTKTLRSRGHLKLVKND